MKAYEAVFIFPPESAPEARKNQLKNLDDLFVKFKAQITQKNEWGRKPLGYPVKKFQDGHYLIVDFQMDPANATEFRKGLELQEELIKYMVTIKQIAKEKPVAAKPPAATPAPSSAPSSAPSNVKPHHRPDRPVSQAPATAS